MVSFKLITIFVLLYSTLTYAVKKNHLRIAIVGGSSDKTEVLDLTNTHFKCQDLPDYPEKGAKFLASATDENLKSTICGGQNQIQKCYSLEKGAWKPVASLNTGRHSFAMTKSPIKGDGSKLFAVGGATLKTTEVLTEQGWKVSTPLPVEISGHCMVQINETTTMVIGGAHGTDTETPTTATFYFNGLTKVWSSGPKLNRWRKSHACGMIYKNSEKKEMSIVVAGGTKAFNTVEFLDAGSSQWRQGSLVPFYVEGSAMVADPSWGVALIGGTSDDNEFLDKVFFLPHAGPDAYWSEMPQKLKTPRRYHTAIIVPDEAVRCSFSHASNVESFFHKKLENFLTKFMD